MARTAIRYLKRGKIVSLDGVDPNRTLLDHLRLERRETGTKEGCNEGDCGACTVVLARIRQNRVVYEAVNSCVLLAGQVDGAEVITVEDLAEAGELHPVQRALVDKHGSQCGFCTPGIVMSLFSLYHSGELATRGVVNDTLAGNLCRCTGYRPIINAALATCVGEADDQFSRNEPQRHADLMQLSDSEDVFIGTEERFFAAPASMSALSALLARHPKARMVAGATDLGLWITKKLDDIPQVIWLGRIKELDFIEENSNTLTLGAMASLAAAAPFLAGIDPDLGEVMRRFGSAQVRNSGTVGGNIANGSPIGDLAPCLIALGAKVMLQRSEKQRAVPLEQFFLGYGRQDRAPDEVLRHIVIPKLQENQRFRAFKVSKRFDEDISAVMGAFHFDLEGRSIVGARIAFGGMAATPKRAAEAEAELIGASLDSAVSWEAAIAALGADFQPIDDARASGAYRLATARALLQKALFEIGAAPSALMRIVPTRGGEA